MKCFDFTAHQLLSNQSAFDIDFYSRSSIYVALALTFFLFGHMLAINDGFV